MASSTATNGAVSVSTASGVRVVEVPLELHEYIISFLDNWTETAQIAKCALVCRRWLHFSRFKLYFLVQLDRRHQWTAFKHVVSRPSLDLTQYLERVREMRIWPRDDGYFDEQRTKPRIGWGKGQERPWGHMVLLVMGMVMTRLCRGLLLLSVWSLSMVHMRRTHTVCFDFAILAFDDLA